MRCVLGLIFALVAAAGARAADLTVQVRTPQGKPIPDAVVTAYPNGAYDKTRIRFAWPYKVSQHNLMFDPFVLIVPVGAEVSFPNQDSVRHHVYSFSPAKSFELKLYGQDETRAVRFDKPGVVALGCNIHDQMSAFIVVVDTPFAAKTDASGVATLHGLSGESARVQVWHPYAKTRGGVVVQTTPLSVGTLAVSVDIRPAPKHGAY